MNQTYNAENSPNLVAMMNWKNNLIGILRRINLLSFFLACYFLINHGTAVLAQTYPSAQSLPLSQSFSSLTPATVTTYPAGFQGWAIGTAASTSFRTTDPTGDRALTASGTAASTAGNVYNYLDKIGFLNTGSLDLSICLAINTTGKTNISVQYDAMNIRNPYDGTTNTRVNEMVLQYKIGSASGSWTTITSTAFTNNTTLQNSGTTGQNVTNKTTTLPAACENQSAIYLRWVARDVSGGGARPSFAIDNINVTGTASAPPLSASASSGTIACFGGTTTVTVSATGGTPPYTGTGTFTVSAGTYNYTVTDNAGATATTSITVTQPTAITSNTSISACDSTTWNGTTYTTSGNYSFLTTASNGCDSTASLALTINSATTSSTSITSTVPYTWNGNTYSNSGTYTYTTTNAAGCDSTATLILTISAAPCTPTTSTTTASACNSYTWNGSTYTTSGSYNYVTLNAGGCDSTATLVLTINNSSTSTTSATACNTYSWNGNTYTSSGTYTYNTTNAAGCDSIATLNLTIRSSSSSTNNISACNSYTWNGNTYTTSGTYTYSTTNAVGCDSIATLNLTINTFSSQVVVLSETMGSVGSTTAIATHETNNGFDNDGLTMSGTADIRSTSTSNTYTGASGAANVFFTNNGTASFQISGINTVGVSNLVLGFGNLKTTTASNGSELVVEISTDGTNFSPLTVTPMNTGTGTTGWQYRTSTGTIPNAANLTIRWRTTSATIQFRIDDVKLTGLQPVAASITASGATTFCPGGSVTLTSSGATSYLWNTGATTQSISVTSSGTYSCIATDLNGCTSTTNSISVNGDDFIAPTAICQNITVPLDINGEAIITAAQINNGSFDNCGISSISLSNDYFTSGELGANSVDLIVIDNNGNISSCTATVTVIDGFGPTMNCNNLTVYLDANGTANITTAQVDNGSFDGDGIDTLYLSRNTLTCADIAVAGATTPTDLFISEYIEGSVNNKCVELFNGTNAPIDLTAGSYQLRFYFNGATTASTTINLSGIVAPGETHVVCASNSDANVLAIADQVSASFFFNGDDAIQLTKDFGFTVLDVFGRIGEDPGNGWGVAPLSTVDQTLRRRSTVTSGVNANPASGFPTLSSEWNAFPVDNIANLGSHFVNGTSGGASVTLTGVDPSGNISTCTSTITVLDTISPVASCKNVTLYLDATGNASLVPAQIDNGSSDNCGIANMIVSQSAFNCSNIGANTVTLTVSDVYGNSASCSATVTVSDTLPPAAGYQNVTIYLNATGNATLTASQVNNNTTDNCGTPTLSVTPTSFDCGDLGAVNAPTDLLISEYVEGSGNNKCIELYNGTTNAINLATGGYQLRLYFNGATTFTTVSLTGTVAAGGTYLICNNTATAPFLALANQTSSSMTYNGDDALVLVKSSGTQIIDIFGRIGEDPGAAWGTAPVITVDQNLRRKSNVTSGVTTNPASGFPTLASQWTSAGLDNTSNLGSHFMVIGNNTAQFTVTDAGGNSLTVPVGVTVKDTIKPVASCQNLSINLNASGTASITAAQIDNGSSDNCGIANMTISPSSFTCANTGTNVVTLTVTDLDGNTSTCTATVTVTDNSNPTITAPIAVSATTNTGCTATSVSLGTPTTADNCSVASVTNNAPSAFPLGTTTVTWTVTDVSGNTATATQTVTVTDNVNPTITAPSNKNVTTNTGCTATGVSLGTPTTADNCSVASVTNNAPSAFPLGTTTITWTVTDGSGNTATATQTVTVTDNVNPTITAPAAVSTTTNTGCTATSVSLGSAITNDNCSVASVTNNAPTAFQLGTTTVTWTVTDGSGNTATATQTVTVTDNVNPTITAPAAVSATTNTGCTATGVALGTPTTADNCSVASVTNNAPSAFPLGTTTVTWTVTDGSGNTATATQVVTVTDNINPTITAPSAVSANTNTNCTATGVSLGTPTTADNCSVASVTNNAPSAFPLGTTTVTWTVTDGSGNTATATQVVTVTDNVNPSITAPAAVSATTNTGCTATGVSLGTPTTADNCSVASVTNNAPAAFPVGTTTVTWTVTDGSGNTATATQIVTVTDNVPPTAVCQSLTVNLNASGSASITAAQINNGSSDNCGIASVTVAPTSFNCSNVGANTVTLTVTDVNGNSSTCTATVTVVDNIAPTAVCQNITLNLSASGTASVTAAQINNGSSDNCGIANLTLSKTSFNCSNVGVNTVTLTVTDVNGNSSTCSATVTVVDNIAPAISCPSNITANNTTGLCGAVINYTAPVGTDICGATTVQTAGLPSGSLFPVGTTVNTYTVTDPSGNQTSCSFSVSITDTQAPVFSNVPSNIIACNPVSWTAPSVTDNCAGVQVTSSHVPGSVFPSGTTTVTYTATDVYGLISTASFNVTVSEPSIAANSITSNRDFNNICAGENITLTINGGTLGAGASWKWYTGSCGGTLLSAYNGQTSITVAPTTTTTYYARAEGQCNSTACVSITVNVSSGAPGTAPVFSTLPTAAAPGVNSTVCVNPVPGATFYQWFTQNGHNQSILFNGQVGPIQTSTNCVNVSFVLPQQNYFIRVFAGNACGRTNQTNAAGIRGSVSASTCINGPTLVCPGQTQSYTACPITNQTSVSYNWQIIPAVPGTATISFNGTNATVNYLPGFTSAQICVNGISTFGLAGPSYCINVSTNAPTPGAITGLTTPCEGSTQTYTIAAVPNATSYTWSSNIVGAVVTGNGTSATVVFPANVFAGNVCVVANSSCGTSAPSCLAVTSGQPGVPGAISGPVSGICNASNVNYSLATSNANSYNWIVPAGVTISGPSNLNAVNLNFGAGFTSGTITVEAFYDCGSATSSITVDGAPDAPSLTPAVICPEASELYTASSTGATSYNWTLSGDDYSACTNPPTCSQYFVIWSLSGGSMSVTATNSCGTSTATAISGSSCRNEVSGLDSKVYPNPTNGKLFVEFRAQVAGEHTIFVTDLTGKMVYSEKVDANGGNNLKEIDLSGANAGLYMVYVKDPKGTISVNKVGLE